jgi:3-oxoacyl-[acyl-carrier-protein] synthase II
MSDAGSGFLALRYGARGPNLTTVTACSSSAHAVGEAARAIARGDADVMLAGGSEAVLVPFAFAGFDAMRALSQRNDAPQQACRPFDADRDGMVMGEGGAVLVLEERRRAVARGASVYAELVGYGMSADAHHMVEPDPAGGGAALAMRRALADAGLGPQRVGYINAHGTSTVKGDIAETLAIRHTFGDHADRLAVSSTKSMHGHLLGAAGALELLIACLAVARGSLPPTINLDRPGPQCDLDYVPNVSRPARIEAAMSNSFAFGGHNVSLLVMHPEAV